MDMRSQPIKYLCLQQSATLVFAFWIEVSSLKNQASCSEQDRNRRLSVSGIVPVKKTILHAEYCWDTKHYTSQGPQATTDKEHGLTRNGYSVTSR